MTIEQQGYQDGVKSALTKVANPYASRPGSNVAPLAVMDQLEAAAAPVDTTPWVNPAQRYNLDTVSDNQRFAGQHAGTMRNAFPTPEGLGDGTMVHDSPYTANQSQYGTLQRADGTWDGLGKDQNQNFASEEEAKQWSILNYGANPEAVPLSPKPDIATPAATSSVPTSTPSPVFGRPSYSGPSSRMRGGRRRASPSNPPAANLQTSSPLELQPFNYRRITGESQTPAATSLGAGSMTGPVLGRPSYAGNSSRMWGRRRRASSSNLLRNNSANRPQSIP